MRGANPRARRLGQAAGPVVLESRRRFAAVLHRILVGPVRFRLGRDLLGDHLADAVPVLPVDVSKAVVERLDVVAQVVQLRFGHPATATSDSQILQQRGDLFR